jgi:hypothetical protein
VVAVVTRGDGVMDMVERVARAICKQEYGDENAGWDNQIPAAIAAIEAMREPTDEMCEFAEDNFDRNGDPIAVCHRAMIEAILKSTRETA